MTPHIALNDMLDCLVPNEWKSTQEFREVVVTLSVFSSHNSSVILLTKQRVSQILYILSKSPISTKNFKSFIGDIK